MTPRRNQLTQNMSWATWGSFLKLLLSGDHHGTNQETMLLAASELLSSSNWLLYSTEVA